MTVMSLSSNLISTNAQYYLEQANSNLQSSVNRLASGNAIDKASDNVAGLAVGTILQTNVSTLKAALTNVSQAQSMLGVADGALRNDINILGRLKSLATQATSGTLSAQAYSFLNQEFNNLVAEIDQIADTTNFNGINLIDGSLYVPAKLTTNTTVNTVAAQGTLKIAASLAANAAARHIFINGAQIAFLNAANYSAVLSGTNDALTFIDTTVNSNQQLQAAALYDKIQSIVDYAGTNAYLLGVKQQLSQMSYSYDGNVTLTLNARAAGTIANGNNSCTNFAVGADSATASDVLVNGGNASNVTSSTSIAIGFKDTANGYNPIAVGVNGNLNAGTFASGTSAYNGATATTFALGLVGNNVLKSLNTSNQSATGIDVSLVSNNPAFVGKVGGFKADYVSTNVANLSIDVGGITYEASTVNTNFNANELITFRSLSNNGGSFNIKMTGGANNVFSVASQSDADAVSVALNAAFSDVTFYQKRTLDSYQVNSGFIIDNNNNNAGDLTGSSWQMIGSDFRGLEIGDIVVTAPIQGATNATIKMTLTSGETFISGYDKYGNASALGTSIAAGNSIGLVSTTNPNNILIFNYGAAAATSLSMSSATSTLAIQQSLKSAFGINSGASGVMFQVGLSSNDNIAVQVKSAKTQDLFLDNSGNYMTPNLLNLSNAQVAGSLIDSAISAVTTVIASIGALQSRFNYAGANLNTAIQNQDAARGVFLDTDIPSESASFAQAQVRVQAGVAVLAQANQLPNILLELITSR